MPKSRVRRRADYTPPPTRSASKQPSPPWVGALMAIFFLVGIAWLVVYYVSGGDAWGIRTLGAWNLAIGFGLIMIGFGFATRWR